MQHQSSTQRVGALLIHRPARVDQHTGGSCWHPQYTGARKGWLWVAHVIRQHSSTVQKHPNMVAEQCRSRARIATRSTRTTTTNAVWNVGFSDGYRRRSRMRKPWRLWCVYGVSRGGENRRSQLMWKSVLVKVMTNRLWTDRQGTLPRCDHHLCSDSSCWKSCREIVTQSSCDGAEHEWRNVSQRWRRRRRGARSRTPWGASRASDVLEMIQQKVDASQVWDRRSHSLQQSRRRSEVLQENPQEKTNFCSGI